MSEAEFWTLTPVQIDRGFLARGKALKREHNERMSLAWHTAALPRAKRWVPLVKLLEKDRDDRPPQQSWQRQVEIAKAWTSVLGGTIKGKAN